VLWRKFGPKKEEVTRGWKTLHGEELHNVYASPNINGAIITRRMRWSGYVARMGEIKNAYKIFVGKPEGTRPLRRPRIR